MLFWWSGDVLCGAALPTLCHHHPSPSFSLHVMRGMGMHSQGTSTGRVSLVQVVTLRPSVAAQLGSCRMHGSILDSWIVNTSSGLTKLRRWMQFEPLLASPACTERGARSASFVFWEWTSQTDLLSTSHMAWIVELSPMAGGLYFGTKFWGSESQNLWNSQFLQNVKIHDTIDCLQHIHWYFEFWCFCWQSSSELLHRIGTSCKISGRARAATLRRRAAPLTTRIHLGWQPSRRSNTRNGVITQRWM